MTKVKSLWFFVLMLCVFASANLKGQEKQPVKKPATKPAEDKKPAKVDVSGTWNVEIEVTGQTGEPVFTFEQNGDKITGTYQGLLGELELTGKVTGQKVEVEFSTDQGKVVYTGSIDKDAMKGEARYGDSFSGKWTARRSIDVTGKWNVKVEVGGQTGEPLFTFKQDGEKITGKYEGLLGEHDVTGKVTGAKIEFEFTIDEAKAIYTGTIDKDTMKGETKYGDALSGTWTANREKAKREPDNKSSSPPAAGFTHTENVIYGRKHGLALTMDVFAPKEKANGRGIIFCVSGGWFSSKESTNPLIVQIFLKEFLDRGYTVFAVVHGSQPKFTIPEVLDDMHRAVRFVRANAKKYGVDPDRLGISGGSAGGHLSLMQGTAPRPGNPTATDPVERESSKVAAVACFYPPTDFLNYGTEGEVALGVGTLKDFKAPFDFHELDSKSKSFVPVTDEAKRRAIGKQISPVYSVTKDDALALIIHGDADKLVPIQQAELMVARLKDAGVPAELVVKKGMAHGWPGIDKDQATLADWFDKHLLEKK